LKLQEFLQKPKSKTLEDIELQFQMLAYIVAKHYGISLTEVLNMTPEVFTQSYVWAIAVEEEKNRNREKANKENTTGNETVKVDYSFLELEDF
jgi:hypothetical protein|tara:strand:- start:960 stop:1238 length:279 start_codon:yes stop_codon:yes gene_type:complete